MVLFFLLKSLPSAIPWSSRKQLCFYLNFVWIKVLHSCSAQIINVWFNEFLHMYRTMQPATVANLEHSQHPQSSLPPATSPSVFLPKGNPDSGCYDIGQGHMGFKCNASISINSKMYLLDCARVQGSILGLFPEVTCKRNSF